MKMRWETTKKNSGLFIDTYFCNKAPIGDVYPGEYINADGYISDICNTRLKHNSREDARKHVEKAWENENAKPRYRLMKLSDCANGTRFYFYHSKLMLPYTLISNSHKRYEAIYHGGHDFNIMAKRFRTSLNKQVWAKVN